MDADYFRFIFDYLYWARDRVLAATGDLTEEEYAREGAFTYKSVRGMLAHALSGESAWLARLRDEPAVSVRPEDVPTPAALRQRWVQEEAKHRAYLEKATDADVSGDIVWTGRDGVERRMPAWQILTLVFHHTVQHRSEAAEALTLLSHSPGDMDLMIYTRERGL